MDDDLKKLQSGFRAHKRNFHEYLNMSPQHISKNCIANTGMYYQQIFFLMGQLFNTLEETPLLPEQAFILKKLWNGQCSDVESLLSLLDFIYTQRKIQTSENIIYVDFAALKRKP